MNEDSINSKAIFILLEKEKKVSLLFARQKKTKAMSKQKKQHIIIQMIDQVWRGPLFCNLHVFKSGSKLLIPT